LVEFITEVMTLLPGDVVSTGTPAGVGPMADGDEVSVSIESIGTLTNPISWETGYPRATPLVGPEGSA